MRFPTKVLLLLLSVFCISYTAAVSQTPITYSSADIYQQIKKTECTG